MITPLEQFEIITLIPLYLAGFDISFTNAALWMCIVAGVVAIVLTWGASSQSLVPTRMQSLAEMSYGFIHDMVVTATGEEGLQFFPFVFTLFMFVFFANLIGLMPPIFFHPFTITSHIIVTFALAAFVFLTVVYLGFRRHGLRFLKLFAPNVPIVMLILLIPIEIISFLSRPISHSVRLFANMLAGHTMLNVFGSFVVGLGAAGGLLSGLSILPMLGIVAVAALEFLIAFLQAYVFAILAWIYLNDALHMHEH